MATTPAPPEHPRIYPPLKCSTCDSELFLDGHPHVVELEAQVRLLSEQAADAAAKLATYETELLALRSGGSSSSSPTFLPPERSPSPANRISSFLFPSTALRRSGGPPSPPPECSPAELAKERSLRLKAEERLQQVTAELEDLSASLFQSANEMVAEERRARSKLEERVVVLERRDSEKQERLGVLERAVDRISRVREILTGSAAPAVGVVGE